MNDDVEVRGGGSGTDDTDDVLFYLSWLILGGSLPVMIEING